MPSYGSQLLANRGRVQFQQPDLTPIYSGYDARSARHDASQAGYASHVKSIMDAPTLDPTEKQRRLDTLRNDFFSMNEKYQGNLSDARDDIVDLIVQNRKDPYWQADKARAEGYQRATQAGQKLALQGQTPLYQTTSGEYVSDLDQRFGSLTDEFGNYKPMTDYDVLATQQLNYEKPLRQAFGSIKANMSSHMGRPVTDGEIAQMMGAYIKTGTTRTNNPNIDRAMQGVVENYMTTPEWKQLQGRYGEGAYEMLQGMAGNVADQYRFTEQKESAKFAPKGKTSKKKGVTNALWDRERKPVIPVEGRMLRSKFQDEKGNSVSFEKKYPSLNNLMKDDVVSESEFRNQIISAYGAPSEGLETKQAVIQRMSNKIAQVPGTSDEEKANAVAEVMQFVEEDYNKVGNLDKEIKDYNKTVSLFKKLHPELNNMTDQQVFDIVNANIDTGDADIVHTFPNSAVTTLGGEGLFTGKEDDPSAWRDRQVYYKEKGSNNWELVTKESGIGIDRSELHNDVRRENEETRLTFDSDKGSGYYASGENYEVFIPTTSNMNKYLKPLQQLESNERALRSTTERDLFKVQSGIQGNTAMIRTVDGPVVIDFGNAPQYKIKETLQKYYDSGGTSNDVLEDFQQRAYTVDQYNAMLKKYLVPVEEVGHSQ